MRIASKTRAALVLGSALALAACESEPTDAVTDAGQDVAADQDEVAEADIEPGPPAPRVFVIDTMGFATETEPGVAKGFNLDGQVSDGSDPETCGHGDFTSPEGEPGVDNTLATLVPLFELTGLGAAEGLIQSTIDEGGILLMWQVDGVDDPVNDDAVSVMVRAGEGVPLLGTDGLLLAGQTFGLHPDSPDSRSDDASIEDGVLFAGPFTLRLPLVVFGVRYELTFHDAYLRARWTEDGRLVDGVLGGAVPYGDLIKVGELAAQDDASVLPAIELVFGGAMDMAPDDEGVCTRLSGAFQFTAVSAFLLGQPE